MPSMMPGETGSSWFEEPAAGAELEGAAGWAEGPTASAEFDGWAEGGSPAG